MLIILEQGDTRYPQFSGLENICEVSLPVEMKPYTLNKEKRVREEERKGGEGRGEAHSQKKTTRSSHFLSVP